MGRKLVADVKEVCEYIYQTGCTVREAADHFEIGKSTVHRYCKICPDKELRSSLEDIAELNFANKHLNGGRANKKRWEAVVNE